jgi:hypothetical protein
MKPDFSLLLVLLTGLTGVIWLLDSLLLRRRRMDRAVQREVQLPRDPVVIEYSRSLFDSADRAVVPLVLFEPLRFFGSDTDPADR